MGTKQLLIIIFIACQQIALAGNGIPAKKQNGVDFNFNGGDQKRLHINFKMKQESGSSEEAGYKGPERYYMKNTLNVLKKPLHAMQTAPVQNPISGKQQTA